MIQRWVLFAFLSMFFAGFTAVIAKKGLTGISAEIGLAVRTVFVFAFVALFALLAIPPAEAQSLRRANFLWLGVSGLTTALSWVFYYKALKQGDVATVALIDKGSVVVAIFLAWLILREAISMRTVLGAALIVMGLVVIARK